MGLVSRPIKGCVFGLIWDLLPDDIEEGLNLYVLVDPWDNFNLLAYFLKFRQRDGFACNEPLIFNIPHKIIGIRVIQINDVLQSLRHLHAISKFKGHTLILHPDFDHHLEVENFLVFKLESDSLSHDLVFSLLGFDRVPFDEDIYFPVIQKLVSDGQMVPHHRSEFFSRAGVVFVLVISGHHWLQLSQFVRLFKL